MKSPRRIATSASDCQARRQRNIDNNEAYLIERPQFVLSYNGKKHNPNWVSWQLRKSDLGKADRGPFEPDPLLPKGFLKITTKV